MCSNYKGNFLNCKWMKFLYLGKNIYKSFKMENKPGKRDGQPQKKAACPLICVFSYARPQSL